ncbi:MAG: ATP-binding cassette domain-containing protein [Opitutales bacterium]|nr:ATP-binding cassette domain-containing protein [Opitutales bacterium]
MPNPLVSLRNIRLSLGGPALLDDAGLEIFPGERVCLIGRNGAGKSTLLRILAGETPFDSGERHQPDDTAIAFLPQEVPDALPGTVEDVLRAGADPAMADWEAEARLGQVLEDMRLEGSPPFTTLSAGMKRRALLGRCLMGAPGLLLLDEPTNHLDIEAVGWMETFLAGFPGALLFVTHDRAFLNKLSTRILDLDRGRLISWDCDYTTYLRRKEEWLEAEARQNEVFDKKLRQEEAWLRQGIKARRTRNEGRKRALLAMREEHRQRRAREGSARMGVTQAARSGARVIRVQGISFGFGGDAPVIDGLDLEIERGDRVGIVGPNGVGKSTLLRLLLGELKPRSGEVTHGTKLEIAYFDQLRNRLDDDAPVRDAVADGQETIEINGKRKHVVGYLEEFLFSRERIRGPVRNLSGGERNRLLLARLFTRPCNVLVMDEPTNDLDMETLELLEDLLADFAGTVLVVSHDRAFLDNVTTDLLVMEGDGRVLQIAGGYADYELYKKRSAPPPPGAARQKSRPAARASKPRKFLNRERWELERLPREIEELEAEQQQLTESLADPGTYRDRPEAVEQTRERLREIEESILGKFTRWEELEALRKELDT